MTPGFTCAPGELKENHPSTQNCGDGAEDKALAKGPEETKEKGSPFQDEGKRVVLLVTAPIGSSFRLIVRAIRREPPPNPPVKWSSHDNSDLPGLESRPRFTTHYALCVMDSEKWDDPSLSLLQKLTGARFWDHPVYIDLRRDWKYMPVFWNCHDLAIRLAHIILSPSMDVRFLKRLMNLLYQAYSKEVDWYSKAIKVALGGYGAMVVGAMSSVPPLAAAGAGVYVAGWCVGFFGPSVQGAKVRVRERYMRKLEERYPELRELHF
ncbi:hypothetical protein BJX76DRAFT_364648 [Aspergillus varians]